MFFRRYYCISWQVTRAVLFLDLRLYTFNMKTLALNYKYYLFILKNCLYQYLYILKLFKFCFTVNMKFVPINASAGAKILPKSTFSSNSQCPVYVMNSTSGISMVTRTVSSSKFTSEYYTNICLLCNNWINICLISINLIWVIEAELFTILKWQT